MDINEPIIRITDEAFNSFPVWFDNFMATPVPCQLLDPKTSHEILFQSLVFSLASSFKNNLKALITPLTTESEFVALLETSKVLVPELVINADSAGQPDSSFKSDDSIFDLAQEIKDEPASDDIDCDVFRRVNHIFNLNSVSDQDLFNSLDLNHDGRLTVLEFWAGLKHHDSRFTFEEAREVFKILDGDKDGAVYLDDLRKRRKFIERKAFDELHNPLSCAIFPEPLNPNLIHGVLKISIGKVSGLKGGPRSLRFRLKGHLEYISHDFTDNHFPLNFKCEFPFENQDATGILSTLELELLNKNVVEGSGSFNWSKSHQVSSDFAYKHKVDLKTSLGQAKGSVSLLVNWTVAQVKTCSEEELRKIKELKGRAERFRESLEDDIRRSKGICQRFSENFPKYEETDDCMQESYDAKGFVKDQSFILRISQTSFEGIRTPKSSKTLGDKPFDGRSPCKLEFCKTNSLGNRLGQERPKTPNYYSNVLKGSSYLKAGKERAGKLNKSFGF